MDDHFIALLVVIPLLASPICVLLHHARWSWLLALVTSSLSMAIAIQLLNHIMTVGPISYAMGGWAAPWGIEYRADALNAIILLVVSGISTIVLLFAKKSVEAEIETDRIYLFYTGWLLCLAGMLGMAVTGDAFNLFVFLEISSLSTYLLVSFGKDRRALHAAFQYLIVGTIGASFILIGIGLLYDMTGTLNMSDLARLLPEIYDIPTVQVGFAFFARW